MLFFGFAVNILALKATVCFAIWTCTNCHKNPIEELFLHTQLSLQLTKMCLEGTDKCPFSIRVSKVK